MQLVLKFRHLMPAMVVEEFDNIVATIRAFFTVEHKGDGRHGAVTADSVTTNALTVTGITSLGPTITAEILRLDRPANPVIYFIDRAATTDQRRLQFFLGTGSLILEAINDAETVAQRRLLALTREAGDLTILRTVVSKQPAASAALSAPQSIPNAVFTQINFNTTMWEVVPGMRQPGALHVLYASPFGGIYQVTLQVTWQGVTPAGQRVIRVLHNGVTEVCQVAQMSGNLWVSQTTTILVRMNANDYVVSQAYQDSGGAVGLNGYFQMVYVSGL